MKNIVIKGSQFLQGKVQIPPSKSLSHRCIIAAGLAHGQSTLLNLIYSVDINTTLNAMEQVGSYFLREEDSIKVVGNKGKIKLINSNFQCEESGSTLRFMIPIAMMSHEYVYFNGKNALVHRPLTPYLDLFKEKLIHFEYDNQLPLKIKGSFKSGKFVLAGNVSSQFISGLLFVLPLLDGNSEIEVLEPFESRDYVGLTIDVLKDFGVVVEEKENKYMVRGNQKYCATTYVVEGDFSQVAFWLVAGLLNGDIQAENMKTNSKQGDRQVLDIIKNMSGHLRLTERSISVKKQSLKSTIIDGSQCPDIIPVLAVLASVTPGQTEIINAGRLRIKECDRLKAIAIELNKLGGDIIETEDGLIIKGKEKLKGGKVNGWHDHRIVMSLVVASLACEEAVYIEGSDAITKSYPHFLRHFKALGGEINEWHMEA